MNLAFKRYFQKHKIGGKNYKEFFQPSNNVKTLSSIGCANLLGFRRTPFFSASPSILKEVRLIAWKAVQQWQLSARTARFGESFYPKSNFKSSWTPDSVVWLYATMEKRKQDKLASASGIGEENKQDNPASSTASVDTPVVINDETNSHDQNSSVFLLSSAASSSSACSPATNKNAHKPDRLSNASASVIKCFYGHEVSSATDWQGREQWRFSPSPPWPLVPPARPLCQKCYLYHRAAFLRGDSQYHFLHLYTTRPPDIGGATSSSSNTNVIINSKRDNPSFPFLGGASSSTERPPG
jgi:hypothetical protein